MCFLWRLIFFQSYPYSQLIANMGWKCMGTQTNSCVVNIYHQTKKNLQYTTKTVKPPFFGLQKKFLQIKLVCKMILSSPCLLSSPRYKVTQANRCAVQHPKHSQWEFLGTKQIMLRIQICWLLLIIYPLATTQAIGVCH